MDHLLLLLRNRWAFLASLIAGAGTLLLPGCETPGETVMLSGDTVPPPEMGGGAPPESPDPDWSGSWNSSDPVNDAARYLAGLGGASNSSLAPLRNTVEWMNHQRRMRELWDWHMDRRGRDIRGWTRRELADLQRRDVVFYPFGGPDFLYVNAYFPKAERYILVGLESIEPMPELTAIGGAETIRALGAMQRSVENLLTYGYFQTKDMRANLAQTRFRGVLPLLYTFIALSGNTIELLEPVGLDANGNAYLRSGGKHAAPGVRFALRSPTGSRRELYYFQEDLSNGNLGSDRRILAFARSGGAPVTYLKSASYLMHGSGFSIIRDGILSESAAVVQDPSGIPFRYFQKPQWQVSLYGNYIGTIDIFTEYYQRDLAAAFKEGPYPVGPLDFGAGYNLNKGWSSLLVARRVAR